MRCLSLALALNALATEPEEGLASRPVPLLGYGTANIRDPKPIAQALEAGYELIDTAVLYGNHLEVGEGVRRSRDSRPRESVYLVTKFGFWPETFLHPLLKQVAGEFQSAANLLRASKGGEVRAVGDALVELGVDYVDLCLVHSPVTTIPEFLLAFLPHRFGRFSFVRHMPTSLGPLVRGALAALDGLLGGGARGGARARAFAWRALEEAKQQGQCREIGVSNYALHLLHEMESYASEMPAVHELEVHPRFQPHDVLEFCRDRGIHIIGYGNGVSLDRDEEDGTVAEVARRAGRSRSQVLLRWAVQRNVTVLPRSSRQERIIENSRIFDFQLSAEDMAKLDALDEDAPFYWDTSSLAAMPGPSDGGGAAGRSMKEPEL